MKKLLLILLCLPILVLSQTEQCGTMEYLEYLQAQDPQLEQKMVQDEIDLQNRIQNQSNSKTSSVIRIPVVVHVVYNNSTENISDAQIQSQIDILNEDFRRLNVDASNTPSVFQSIAADIEVEFCLASQDPNGIVSTGITRTLTSQSSFTGNDDVKYSLSGGINAWNTNDYLNIWVCNLSSGLLGYANFPGTGNAQIDGVVCDYAYFGNTGTATAPYDLGRTATHEVGHWLNLRHIWGDANCGDDFCNDTPTQFGSNGGCPSFPYVTCANGPNGGDMFMNYMDYTDDACMNLFTEDQKTRMIDAINTHRSDLLTSNGCSADVYGCMNSFAFNYNPNATIDDNSCCFLAGCTDPAAYNYNVNVCEDDASCVYSGCTDPTATNYNPVATIYDGSCEYCIYGCMNPLASNYNSVATCPTSCSFPSSWDYVACDSLTLIYSEYMYNSSFLVTQTGSYIVQENYFWDPNDPWGPPIGVSGYTYANVLINYSTDTLTYITTCDSYTWSVDGNTYTTSGTYTDVSNNADGCVHTETLILTINNSTASTSNAAACDSYTWNGTTYTTSGVYYNYNTNAAGCDNTEILVLTINSSTSNSTTQTACDSYTWSVDGNTYTTSGTYTDVSTNAAGCDHTETLNLTVNSSTSNSTTQTACDSYTWSVDGNTYTTSGTYTDVSTNAAGCDHTETLNLTVNSSTSNSTTQTACDSYTWSVDGNTYTTSGTYTDVSTNAAGCDHTETLNLTVNSSTSSTDTHVACDSFMWYCDGNTYTSSNNTATYVYTNASGCDSTVTLDLTINSSTSNSTTATACDTYTWSVDGNTYTTSGTYTDVSTNTDGCDHTETLELTINSVISSISQSGDSLFAITTPIGLTANWYNIQTEDATTRIWLMEEGATTFMPRFDCSYFIVVSDNACIDTSEIYSYGANAARIGSFITSPNPTSGLVNVKFDNPKNQFVMFKLISNNGSKLDEFITVENNLNIDLSNYPSGSYYLYFNSEDATQGCRLEEVKRKSTKIILNK